ncbi:MAG TPA: SLC13 family permease, partial [Nitrospira sp.]|nr:SLC13 family permease [Nitrospira sp.]
VILAIAFDLIDMAVAALLGVSMLFGFNILAEDDVIAAVKTAGGPLALLFGGMVVARTLAVTGIFDRIGTVFLRATKGSGKRFLLLLIALVTPLCAFLPNATTVILLAPIIIRVAVALDIDFVGPMVLTAIISNSAGLLTLVGDPATFLVASSIGMTFGQYLRKVSLGGLLSLLVLIPLLPLLMPDLWRLRRPLPSQASERPFQRPWFALLALAVLAIMVGLFLVGEDLPIPIGPPAVAIIAASLALLVIYSVKFEPVDNVLRDIDWKTLVFLSCIFFLVEAITKTGLLQNFSLKLYEWFGTEFMLAALSLIAGIGLLSSLLANIPVVAASIVMVKGYLVAVEAVPELALGAHFTDWPVTTLPVFIAMMFGATLGGNATLIGAAANIVSVGICAQNGKPITFVRWLRYGLPFTACQLAVSALYVLALFPFSR